MVEESQKYEAGFASSAARHAYEVLFQNIVTLDLAPGTRISEAEAARQLGVSRQPVREAFQRLAAIGFLSVQPKRATFVTPISEQAIRRAQFIRCSIETEVARTLASAAGPEQIMALEAELEAQRAALTARKRDDFFKLDDRFHRLLCEFAPYREIWEVVRMHKAVTDRLRYLSQPTESGNALSDHEEIIDAIKRRDGSAAASHMRRHQERFQAVIDPVRAKYAHFMGP